MCDRVKDFFKNELNVRMLISWFKEVANTKDTRIQSYIIAERLGVSQFEFRLIVKKLRSMGYPIVSTAGPSGGYWYTYNSEDFNDILVLLENKINSMKDTYSALKKTYDAIFFLEN